jgi:serine/threonine protein kinase
MKVLSKRMLRTTNVEEYIRQEIVIHRILDHPNISKIKEVIESKEKIYIVMEYCGVSLEDMLEIHQTLPENVIKKYLGQLIDAFEYLHIKLRIIHRDVQLSNICVMENENPENSVLKLIDFGLSTYYSKDSEFTIPCGHGCYMAPEMLSGKPYGSEIDIWGLGVCLFKLLTGYFPFRFTEHTLKRQFSIPLEEEELSSECKDLLLRMLEHNPKKRITISEIKEHPWLKDVQINCEM